MRALVLAAAFGFILQQPTFRTRVELVRLDVTVVDRDGNPVRDLRPEDFMVTLDGQPRRVAFARFYGSEAVAPPSADVPVSVATNTASTPGRVVVLVADLESRLAPGDRVQTLDTAEGGTHALLRLGMPPATRFVYDFHFFHDVDHPTIRDLRGEFIQQLEARPPRFVVVFDRSWPTGALDRIARFPALSRFLEDHYSIVQRRSAYVILEKRHRP